MSSPIRIRQFSNVTMLSSFERAGCDAPKDCGSRLVGQTSDALNGRAQPVDAVQLGRVGGTQPGVCVQVARSHRAAAILLGNRAKRALQLNPRYVGPTWNWTTSENAESVCRRSRFPS
jgi:hypothetical protein